MPLQNVILFFCFLSPLPWRGHFYPGGGGTEGIITAECSVLLLSWNNNGSLQRTYALRRKGTCILACTYTKISLWHARILQIFFFFFFWPPFAFAGDWECDVMEWVRCTWTLLFEWKDVFCSSVDESVLGFQSHVENATLAWVDWQIARNSSEACCYSGIFHHFCVTWLI